MTSSETGYLLNDDQVADFIINGYHIVKPSFSKNFHGDVYTALEGLPTNPGDAVNDAVPALDLSLIHI